MNFVIGDIHGEYTKLRMLVENIFLRDQHATLIFIGDFSDKGEDPYSVFKYLKELSTKTNCIFLRGNHEYYWECMQENSDKYAEALLKYGAQNTIASINDRLTPMDTKNILYEEFGSILNNLQNYYEYKDFVITHSGIPPGQYLTELKNMSTEDFLFNRYDFISCQQLYFSKKIIFGHTGFYSPFYDGFKIGVDTAACYLETQPLSAFCLDQDFFINSSDIITQLKDINQSYCPAIPRVRAWRQK